MPPERFLFGLDKSLFIHLLRIVFSLAGFKRDSISLLEICLLFSRGLKQMEEAI